MATQRQIAANRRNAARSTGPRTAAGKSLSRFNALKHGIDAKSQCLPCEDPAALAELAAEYHERFAPATPEERALIDTLVSSEWDLRRFRATAAQLLSWAADSDCLSDREKKLPLADGFMGKVDTYIRLQRVIDSTHRNYHRALHDLQKLQSEREALAEPAAEPSQPEQTTAPTPKLASFPKLALAPCLLPEIPDLTDAPAPEPQGPGLSYLR